MNIVCVGDDLELCMESLCEVNFRNSSETDEEFEAFEERNDIKT